MIDRTKIAVTKQMLAMGQSTYDIGLKDERSQLMLNKVFSQDEVLERLGWLKSMNAQGRHLYIRPSNEHGLILIDDLKRDQIQRLKDDKLSPACLIETSKDNFQAWIKVSDRPVPPALRSYIAQSLAKEYGGDPNSADFRHYGRLAGFTNPKPERMKSDGRQPFVLIHEHDGRVAEAGSLWTARALEHINKREDEKTRNATIEAYQQYSRDNGHNYDRTNPLATYQAMAGEILNHYGASTDLSRMDWMIARRMVTGGFNGPDIEGAIRDGSPNLSDRKAASTDNYVRHTVMKAFQHQQAKSTDAPSRAEDHQSTRGGRG